MLGRKGHLIVISGPSGSGKTTLAKNLIEANKKLKLQKSVSFCTRNPRHGEKEGKDYFFISKKEFIGKRKNNEFIEETKYLDAFYGTSKKYLDEALKKYNNIILCLDVNGANSLKELYPGRVTTIFILPPSKKEMEKRVKNRSKMHVDEFKARMKLAAKEKKYAEQYDFVLVNNNLKSTTKKLTNIVEKRLKACLLTGREKNL